MKSKYNFPALGLIFGTAIGGGIWAGVLGANAAQIWVAGAGTALGLIAGACLGLMQKREN